MKKYFAFCFLISLTGFCQQLDENFQRLQNVDTYLHDASSINRSKVFITDLAQIHNLINESDKAFKIVYFFSPGCKSSTDLFPKIYKLYNDHKNMLDFFPISGYRYNKVYEIINYMHDKNFTMPILILDTEKYGNSNNPFKRLDLVSKEFCNQCEYEKMGFSNFFVLDKNNNVVASTTWEINGEEKYNLLFSAILK